MTDKVVTEKLGGNWRYPAGLALFALAGLVILVGVGQIIFGFAGGERQDGAIMLLAGTPEILCLAAAMILGKENYTRLARHTRRTLRQPEKSKAVSRLRYYTGLTGCLANGIPLILYAYVPERLPDGVTKLGILVCADLIFLASIFFCGGEFWEKLRRLFIWEEIKCPCAASMEESYRPTK